MKIQRAWVPVILVAAIGCEEAAQQDPMGIDVAFNSSPVVGRINGHGSTGIDLTNLDASNLDISEAAIEFDDGTVRGRLNIIGGAGGPVAQIVSPSGLIDFWCINVEDSVLDIPGFLFNLYVKDVGDGKTSFDEISLEAGIGVTCTTNPEPTDPFIPLISGNFRSSTA